VTSSPLLAATREELADALVPRRSPGRPVVLVPTMGALHAGHAALLGAAREAAGEGPVVASIFVNPLQFGEGEDLDRYPRTFEADLEVCARAGVDVVFAPGVDEVYPGGEPQVTVEPGPLGATLEGEVRPGHFRGVLTVVAKLFGLVRPDVALFGEKDYQQLVLIRRMSSDLCLGVDVQGVPTVREADGLALSSRNRYLDPEERVRATILCRALQAAADRAPYGLPAARWAGRRVLEDDDDLELDYLAIRTPDLEDVEEQHPAVPTEARVLVAARIGGTRLIDNRAIVLGPVV
jgi:pantoate--beta-alanine ligase